MTPSADDRRAPTLEPGRGRCRFCRFIPLLGLIALAVLALAMGWHREISFETLVRRQLELQSFVAAYGLGAVAVFVALYAVAVALSIPCALILTVTGGILFGALVGAVASVVGATIGATVLFLVAKTAIGEHLVRRAGPMATRLAEGFRDHAFSYLLFLRLVPAFPFFLVNLVPALCGMRLAPFVVATAIGIVPATTLIAFVGAGLSSVVAAQGAGYRACLAAGRADCRIDFDANAVLDMNMILALAALGLLALLPVIVRRVRARRFAGPSA